MAELSNAIDSLLILGVHPLIEIIKDEINAKIYTQTQYLNRTYIKIDTSRIKMLDIVKFATAVDKLTAAGINSVNDSLKLMGREPIDEPWADEHYITKNYQEAKNMAKGGDTDDTGIKN